MSKEELRKFYLERRELLTGIQDLSKELCNLFFLNVDLSKVKMVHLFLPIRNKKEIDTWYILKRLWSEYPHIKTVVPVADFTKRIMKSVEVNKDTEIIENKYGIPEPSLIDVIDDKQIDLVITPLLISDTAGFRVGYGAGFYDRFFSENCRREVVKVGLSFFSPIAEISDVNKFDVPLDQCVYLDGDIN